jgi:hypothetical protein
VQTDAYQEQQSVVIGTAAVGVQDSIDYGAAAAQVIIAAHAFIHILPTAAVTV